MSLYVGCQGFDYLLGCVEVGVAQDAEQALVAKLTQLGVFGLFYCETASQCWCSFNLDSCSQQYAGYS